MMLYIFIIPCNTPGNVVSATEYRRVPRSGVLARYCTALSSDKGNITLSIRCKTPLEAGWSARVMELPETVTICH